MLGTLRLFYEMFLRNYILLESKILCTIIPITISNKATSYRSQSYNT